MWCVLIVADGPPEEIKSSVLSRRIRCTIGLSEEEVAAIDGVQHVRRDRGRYLIQDRRLVDRGLAAHVSAEAERGPVLGNQAAHRGAEHVLRERDELDCGPGLAADGEVDPGHTIDAPGVGFDERVVVEGEDDTEGAVGGDAGAVAEAGEFDSEPGSGIAIQIDVEDAVGVAAQVEILQERVEEEL